MLAKTATPAAGNPFAGRVIPARKASSRPPTAPEEAGGEKEDGSEKCKKGFHRESDETEG